MKTPGLWTVEQIGGGTLRWVSPSRTSYVTEPELEMDASPVAEDSAKSQQPALPLDPAESSERGERGEQPEHPPF